MANQPCSVETLMPPMEAPFPGAWVSTWVTGSPATSFKGQEEASRLAIRAFCSAVQGWSWRAYQRGPKSFTRASWCWAGFLPVTAVISQARSPRIRPSLSVVQVPPSIWRKLAPADSSPQKPTDPSISPGTNHLKPTGTSTRVRPRRRATRSSRVLETTVLPTATWAPQFFRVRKRYSMATAR